MLSNILDSFYNYYQCASAVQWWNPAGDRPQSDFTKTEGRAD